MMRLYKVSTNKGLEYYAHAADHQHAMRLIEIHAHLADDDRVTVAITWELPKALMAL